MYEDSEIRRMVEAYESKSSHGTEPYWKEIGELGAKVIPFFIDAYPNAKRWQQRVSFIYRSIKYARTSEDAVALAVMALDDRSKHVRYRACMLLACSLRSDVLPHLEKARSHKDIQTKEDVLAAIDAIKHDNHNYFVDREHSGKMFLNFDGNR